MSREHPMRTCTAAIVLVLGMIGLASPAAAQNVLIRNATVHTLTSQGQLDSTDVLVRGGRITGIGPALAAPAGVVTVDADGRPLTPGMFAGLTGLGLEEVPAEQATVDHTLVLGGQLPPQDVQWRPEFDVALAFNPTSSAIGVTRVEGFTFAMLAPSSAAGGSMVAGQGTTMSLNGRFDAGFESSRSLFIDIGARSTPLAGGSRAGQFMLLEQAIVEARSRADSGPHDLLTAQGRKVLARFVGGGRIVVRVDREADIRQLLKLAKRERLQVVIAGGAEAWKVADQLSQARIPVLLDPLVNLPSGFDQLAARLDNAALLHAAGVAVAIDGSDTHNARKNRQRAGNAVANGLPWEAGLAALTSTPARIFGMGDRGTIAVGQVADLVLWSGDPLEVTTWAEHVWIDGHAMPMRSRQTELLDRYMPGAVR